MRQRFQGRARVIRRILLPLLCVLSLFAGVGCDKPEETQAWKPTTSDGKPVPEGAMNAPAAGGAFDGAGPPIVKGKKK